MNAPGAEGRGNAGGSGSLLSHVSRPVAVRALVIAGLFAFALTVLPMLLGAYWIKILTATAIFAIVALGLNVLFGRVGLVSLGQIALLSIAAWIGARFFFLTGLPFPVVLLMTGVLTGVVGTLVGLPALRLQRPLSGADHADVRRAGHDRPADHGLPERRPAASSGIPTPRQEARPSGARASPKATMRSIATRSSSWR